MKDAGGPLHSSSLPGGGGCCHDTLKIGCLLLLDRNGSGNVEWWGEGDSHKCLYTMCMSTTRVLTLLTANS